MTINGCMALLLALSATMPSLSGGQPGAPQPVVETLDPAKFAHPPDSARPWVYWFWLSGNVTREGITADLEAMKRVGIGGVLIMEVSHNEPQGPVAFMSPQWRELFKHAVAEAARLGLEVNMNDDAGWAGSGGPWITPEQSMQTLVWAETNVEGPKRFEGPVVHAKTNPKRGGFYRDVAVLAIPAGVDARIDKIAAKIVTTRAAMDSNTPQTAPAADQLIPRERIIDLTGRLDANGNLAWEVPAGKWTLLRIGHTSTWRTNAPAPKSGVGLECDKLSPAGIEAQFAGMMGPIIADAGAAAGKTLVSTHIDSWEVGMQNWTAAMRQEVTKRRGYDPQPYLPIITGRVVESLDVSERFLWDLRQTINELLADNYASRLSELARSHGMRLSIEAYDGPCDDLVYGGRADEPMGEFWAGSGTGSCKKMASAAHIYGKPLVGAESFTATDKERWLKSPGSVKAQGDRVFCDGINRFVIHRYAMQPWVDVRPGMGMGPWGLHYERTQTWWEQTRPWHEYIARCQYLLRQGTFVADIYYLQPQESPQGVQNVKRGGYDFDYGTAEVVLKRMSVRDGRLVLPDGMSYSVMVLPESKTMAPALLAKVRELVEGGATVIGPRPGKSPSLADYPHCDEQVQKLAAELWGDCDGQRIKEHRFGKGRIVWGQTPEEVLAKGGTPPDFAAVGTRTLWIHRRLGDTDIYFVANGGKGFAEECTFRMAGRQVELWLPETGQVLKPTCCEEADGCTTLAMHLEPGGSAFVIFRGKAKPSLERIVSVTRDGTRIMPTTAPSSKQPTTSPVDLVRRETTEPGIYTFSLADGRTRQCKIDALPEPLQIAGSWSVRFDANWGAPQQITMDKLISWSDHSDNGVRYYSGLGTYTTTFDAPSGLVTKDRRLYLDLGQVEVVAEVKLNGKDLGILWKPPYRVEITDTVQPGRNVLEVKVANLWVNRMIGDEQLPEDSERNPNGTLKGWPQWLLDGKSSPTGRYTFATWRLWKKDEPLVPSGLLGPVTVQATGRLDPE